VIKGSPIIDATGAMVNISDPYVMQNVNNDAGERDLMALYASQIANQSALGKIICASNSLCGKSNGGELTDHSFYFTVLTDFESAFVDQLDPVLDDFINDPNAEIAFSMTPPDQSEPVVITYSPTAPPVTAAPAAPTDAPTTNAPTTATP
jgi:hypothetical protein